MSFVQKKGFPNVYLDPKLTTRVLLDLLDDLKHRTLYAYNFQKEKFMECKLERLDRDSNGNIIGVYIQYKHDSNGVDIFITYPSHRLQLTDPFITRDTSAGKTIAQPADDTNSDDDHQQNWVHNFALKNTKVAKRYRDPQNKKQMKLFEGKATKQSDTTVNGAKKYSTWIEFEDGDASEWEMDGVCKGIATYAMNRGVLLAASRKRKVDAKNKLKTLPRRLNQIISSTL